MIQRVLISKSPTFSHLELHFDSGFHVLSGVSGSGKSVFLQAILSAFGFKEPNAALIEVSVGLNLEELGICLEDFGIAEELHDDGFVVSVLKKQNTRYFLNNQAISKKKLNEIAHHFIKYISIKDGDELENSYMLRVLEALIIKKDSKFYALMQEYKRVFQAHKECVQALKEMEEKQKNIESLKDFAQFEISKITAINPIPGEYEKLMCDKKLLSKKEKVMQACTEALEALDNVDSIHKALELLDIDSAPFFANIMETRGLIENGLHEFASLDMQPEELLERIGTLAEINRKYGNEEGALAHLAMQKEKLQEYENIHFDKTQLEKEYEKLTQKLTELAQNLHEKRAKFLPHLLAKYNDFAVQLRLEKVGITHTTTTPSSEGIDMLTIHLMGKEKSVLSSGEYNRMRLAMLCVAATYSAQDCGILLLDEIDANLSGEESEGVAKLLQFLSKHYQVFAVSHQPFMPLLCDKHYLVSKDKEQASTIKLLNKKEKIQEIARMISGSKLDKHALQYAETLLKQQKS